MKGIFVRKNNFMGCEELVQLCWQAALWFILFIFWGTFKDPAWWMLPWGEYTFCRAADSGVELMANWYRKHLNVQSSNNCHKKMYALA